MVLTGILLVTTQDTFAKNPTSEGKAKKRKEKRKELFTLFGVFK